MVVSAIHVSHDRDAQRARSLAHDAAEHVFVAELPCPVFARREDALGPLVAKLAVVHPGGCAGVVDSLDKGFVELVAVHQTTVADRAIHDLDVGAKGHPVAFRVHMFSVQHRFSFRLSLFYSTSNACATRRLAVLGFGAG